MNSSLNLRAAVQRAFFEMILLTQRGNPNFGVNTEEPSLLNTILAKKGKFADADKKRAPVALR